MWQPIETYALPKVGWDFDYPRALFFSEATGIVIGRCILEDKEESSYNFQYDRDSFSFEPTHWMPLPKSP